MCRLWETESVDDMKYFIAIAVVAFIALLIWHPWKNHDVHCNGPQPPNSICTRVNYWSAEDYDGWRCAQVEKRDGSDFTGRFECVYPDREEFFSVPGSPVFPATCSGLDRWLITRNNSGLYVCDGPNVWRKVPSTIKDLK